MDLLATHFGFVAERRHGFVARAVIYFHQGHRGGGRRTVKRAICGVPSHPDPLPIHCWDFLAEVRWNFVYKKGTFFPNSCISANFVLVIIPVPSLVSNKNKDIFCNRSSSNMFIYEKKSFITLETVGSSCRPCHCPPALPLLPISYE